MARVSESLAGRVAYQDSGMLDALLGIHERRDLERHPKLGASWEGFVLEAVVRRLGVDRQECHFWEPTPGRAGLSRRA